MPTKIAIIGAGGHAKVVIEAIQQMPNCPKLVIADSDEKKVGQRLLCNEPTVLLDNLEKNLEYFHVAIGSNSHRAKIFAAMLDQKRKPISILHPETSISQTSVIAEGCFIAARAIISVECAVGENTIMNHAAIVDHDCHIGAASHICPNATLGGGVVIGKQCLIGAGATILPGIRIGDYSTVGAGAVITNDVPSKSTAVGVPGVLVK